MKYAEVLLPLPLGNTFTYRIPEAMALQIDVYCRVVVPFGVKHFYSGVVTEIHDRCPAYDSEVKELFVLLDDKPVIRDVQLCFWQWLSSYYLCTLGEVCRAALPAGLKIESESVITQNPCFESFHKLKPNEQKLMDVLPSLSGSSIDELEKKSGLKPIFPIINSLMAKGAVRLYETMRQGFKPKMETFLRLCESIQTADDINTVLEDLKGAKQQEKMFLDFLEFYFSTEAQGAQRYAEKRIENRSVAKKALFGYSGAKSQVLNGLIQRGVLVAEEKIVSRIDLPEASLEEKKVLTQAQQKALGVIYEAFKKHEITLLHGVTASGKTEIYIRLIQDTLDRGEQALYLMPEITLTTQITGRLRKVFGSRLLVYSSGIPDYERVEIWNRLMYTDEPFVVLGVRSSVFLPFVRLGTVIVSDEQDSSYKQQDPAPRYHARNAALKLAQLHGAKTLLGSSVPSLESYLWAKKGKYGYVKLDIRYNQGLKPSIEIANVSDLRRKNRMKDTLFSPVLKEKIDNALSKGEQVLLFQNRRGFAPFIICSRCGSIPYCVNCDVCLTLHKQKNRLVCHYCGYSIPFPLHCPTCSSEELKLQGFGTEKIEEEVKTLFPNAQIARLDYDTARTDKAYRRILSDFEAGKTQILIGTQMLPKGFTGAHVSVAGILNADAMMNFPDFRAYERAYQLMLQVSESVVRSDRQGVVIIQTSQAENQLIEMVQQFNYQGMAQTQLEERHQFLYPPYSRLILLILRYKNEQILDEIAGLYAQHLKKRFGSAVTGPVYPPVLRVQTLFVRKIMLKIELSMSVSDTRKILEEVRSEMLQYPQYKQIIVHYDVDPQ